MLLNTPLKLQSEVVWSSRIQYARHTQVELCFHLRDRRIVELEEILSVIRSTLMSKQSCQVAVCPLLTIPIDYLARPSFPLLNCSSSQEVLLNI